MLVLVLILVVIALALVLAALFLQLVALAWTSVGISLLASAVLFYDWLQTRSAVRSGRQGSGGLRDGDGDRDRAVPQGAAAAGAVGAGAGAAGGMGGGPDGYGGADMEPATQVLPVVPPPTNAAEETVVMPVVGPSGSTEAPSGASRSSGLSSQYVTESSADEPVTARSADGGTTAADPAAGPEPGAGGDPAGSVAPPTESRSEPARDAGSDAAGAARTSDTTESAAGPAGEPSAGATQAVRAADGAGSSPTAAAGGAVAAGGVVAGGAAAAAAGSAPDRPSDAAGEPASVVAAGGGTPPADDRSRAADGVDTSGEAPEEPRDPAHASLVARLPDEVIVIDEHPRYHVQGCPSLPGQPLIPLPVSEAVELGFTPCGWCTPNRVLSERNPAEAR